MPPPSGNLRIAICSKNRSKVSETFIKAHKELLTGNVLYLHDGIIPTKWEGKYIGGYYMSRWRQVLPHLIYRKYLSKTEAAINFSNFIKKSRVDVVLAEYGLCGSEITPICKKFSIPLVVHFHGYDAYRFNILEHYREGYKEMFSYASKVISVSSDMTDSLLSLNCAKEKIVYNPYGPNDGFCNIEPDLENGYFLSVGRFVEKKAPIFTLIAFQKVQQVRPGARLVMVGEGELLSICKRYAEAAGLNVLFRGAVDHSETIRIFEGAICFVQHSITAADGDKEGTPVSILEAGASGLPVVSTKHGGIMDVVLHGETGFLVNEGDIDGMAENMLLVYDNFALRKTLGESARIRIQDQFSISKHIHILDEVLLHAAQSGVHKKSLNLGLNGRHINEGFIYQRIQCGESIHSFRGSILYCKGCTTKWNGSCGIAGV